MKYGIAIVLMTGLIWGCSEENSTVEIAGENADQPSETNKSVPISDDEVEVTVSFSSGTMAGTYVFKPADGDLMSQINVGFDLNVSTLSATKLVSEDGKHQLMITRPFEGEPTKGSHKAKMYSNDCGSFKFRSLSENGLYSTIRGTYKNCSNTTVSACGPWKDGHVYKSRGVVANFQDEVELEINSADGEVSVESTKIEVVFKGRDSRIMNK